MMGIPECHQAQIQHALSPSQKSITTMAGQPKKYKRLPPTARTRKRSGAKNITASRQAVAVPKPLKFVLLTIGSVCSGLNVEKFALAFLLGGGYQLVDEVFACDTNVHAKAHALANFPRLTHFFDDCCSKEFHNEAPAVDVFCAGFPCQPFSTEGKGLGIKERSWGNMHA